MDRFFVRAVPPKNRGRGVLLALLACAIVLAGALAGQLLVAPLVVPRLPAMPDAAWSAGVRQLVYLVCGFGPVYVLMALVVRMRERRSLLDVFRPAGAVGARHVGLAVCVGAGLSLLPVLWLATRPGFGLQPVADAGAGASLAAGLALGALALFVQSTAEELVFRGWLLPTLAPRMGEATAVIVAALAFAAVHLLNAQVSPRLVLNLLLAGVAMGYIALATHSVLLTGLAHALWNWTQSQLVHVGDGPAPAGALWQLAAPEGFALEAHGAFTAGAIVLAACAFAAARLRDR